MIRERTDGGWRSGRRELLKIRSQVIKLSLKKYARELRYAESLNRAMLNDSVRLLVSKRRGGK